MKFKANTSNKRWDRPRCMISGQMRRKSSQSNRISPKRYCQPGRSFELKAEMSFEIAMQRRKACPGNVVHVAWALLAPLVPQPRGDRTGRGQSAVPRREIVNGIRYIFSSGGAIARHFSVDFDT